MPRHVYKPDSPPARKVERLMAFLEQEGLQITQGACGEFVIHDKERSVPSVPHDSDGMSEPVYELPPMFEYKLVLMDENWQ